MIAYKSLHATMPVVRCECGCRATALFDGERVCRSCFEDLQWLSESGGVASRPLSVARWIGWSVLGMFGGIGTLSLLVEVVRAL